MKKLVILLFLLATSALAQHSISISWVNPPANAVTGITYNVYRAVGSCVTAPFTKVASAITTINFTDSTVVLGQLYCYYVTSINNSVESIASPPTQISIQTTIVIPPVTITVTAAS